MPNQPTKIAIENQKFGLSDLYQIIRLFITGFIMGAADLVPGVSGGTIAFISGIYEDLIETIKQLSSQGLRLVLQAKFVPAWQMIPWKFLLPLAVGIFTAIFSLSNLLENLLSEYPTQVWAFFFGLVVASIWVVIPAVTRWSWDVALALVVGSVSAFFLVGAIPVETPANLLTFFLSGAVAICAMILPGISGSFILLILGKYSQVLSAVNQRDIPVLLAVALGAAAGLAVFSGFLDYLFKHHHNLTVATLVGFLIGSLRKVWPWRQTLQTYTDSHGAIKPLVEKNVWPSDFGSEFWWVVALIFAGFIFVIGFEYLQKQVRKPKSLSTSDLPNEL